MLLVANCSSILLRIKAMEPHQRQLVVQHLINIALQDEAIKSESELARLIAMDKYKLNRWKLGRAKAPPEFVSFALLLISLGSGAAIKQALEQRKDVLKSLEIGD